jgi:hypothetical protein
MKIAKALVVLTILFISTGNARAQIIYSEAANFFHLADQVALWHRTTTTQFRDYWQERYGFSQADKRWFDGFAAIRRKYHPESLTVIDKNQPTQQVFSDVELRVDPLVDAFFSSATIEDALKRLQNIIPSEEIQYLREFFQHYNARLQDFKKDSNAYRSKVNLLNQELTQFRFDQHLRRVETYFGLVKDAGQTPTQRYRSYLVWWPPLSRAELAQIGPYIIIRAHPTAHLEVLGAQVALEGATRSILRGLASEVKFSLAQRFASSCGESLSNLTPRHLEIPLSLALSRMFFDEERQKRQFVATKEWSSDALVSLMSKLLYPELKRSLLSQESFTDETLARAGLLCKELNALSQPLSGRDKKP